MKVYELLNKIGLMSEYNIVACIFDEHDHVLRKYDITRSMLERDERLPLFVKMGTLDYFDIVSNQLKIYGHIKRS